MTSQLFSSFFNINCYSIFKFLAYYFLTLISLRILRLKIWKEKSIMIVLGSGGHTGELLIMLKKLKLDKFSKVFFVSSHNDLRSEGKAREVLNLDESQIKKNKNIIFLKIYRSRNVGQSFFSSIFTSSYSMMQSIFIILKTRPNLIVTNGPGVAIPLVYIGYILNKLLILSEFKILFIESYCRTKSLSLSGKLIQPIADKFIVLWKDLVSNKREYLGKIL
jgi:beta-1,4-N-acetylglucosaminyltransferase